MHFFIHGSCAWRSCARMLRSTTLDIQVNLCNPTTMTHVALDYPGYPGQSVQSNDNDAHCARLPWISRSVCAIQRQWRMLRSTTLNIQVSLCNPTTMTHVALDYPGYPGQSVQSNDKLKWHGHELGAAPCSFVTMFSSAAIAAARDAAEANEYSFLSKFVNFTEGTNILNALLLPDKLKHRCLKWNCNQRP